MSTKTRTQKIDSYLKVSDENLDREIETTTQCLEQMQLKLNLLLLMKNSRKKEEKSV